MMSLVNRFNGNVSPDSAQLTSLATRSYSWRAAFMVTYAIDFMCLSAANLMVLDRMSDFATSQVHDMRKRWAAAGRAVMAAVTLGNAVGLAGNVASAVYYVKTAHALNTASSSYAANKTNDGDDFRGRGREQLQLAGSIASVQLFCEVAVLLLIVVAFVAVGVLSARRVSARLLDIETDSAAAASARALRRQMLGTTAFVFVTFVLRAAFSTMYAVAFQFRQIGKSIDSCPDICDKCHNVYFHITQWMFYTPEFQLTIVLVSSPLALLVALWGMTSEATLQIMNESERSRKWDKEVGSHKLASISGLERCAK
jgi:hypothetical protein